MLYHLRCLRLLLLSLSLTLMNVAHGQSIALPEIGQSGGAIVTPEEERRTGETVMRNIRRAGGMLDDPLLHDYLNHLSYRLVSTSDTQHPQFEFFMINDGAINAFAHRSYRPCFLKEALVSGPHLAERIPGELLQERAGDLKRNDVFRNNAGGRHRADVAALVVGPFRRFRLQVDAVETAKAVSRTSISI